MEHKEKAMILATINAMGAFGQGYAVGFAAGYLCKETQQKEETNHERDDGIPKQRVR